MASILQKPDEGGQIYELKLSTRRGALHAGVTEIKIVVQVCGAIIA